MEPVLLSAELLDRLLDPADPALRARVLTDLLDRPASDRDVTAARARIPDHPWVRKTLAAHNGDGTWGRQFYNKYRGTSWVLLHLTELGVPAELPALRAGVRYLLETARRTGELTGMRVRGLEELPEGAFWLHPIPCLTAHMALVLIRAGEAAHPVTRAALDHCRHRYQPGQGVGCFVMEDSLLPVCMMVVPKVLKAFLALPPQQRTPADRALIDGLVDVLERVRLYRYVPAATAEWRAFARTVTPAPRRRAKQQWIAEGRLEPRRPKEGWLQLSFPLSYNSDLLEVLLLLGEAGAQRSAVVEEGLELLRAKRGRDGMWKLVGGLNGKMYADLDQKGKPSPWITYRALLAFKRFGALERA